LLLTVRGFFLSFFLSFSLSFSFLFSLFDDTVFLFVLSVYIGTIKLFALINTWKRFVMLEKVKVPHL
jgi:hypothetical protein